MQQHDASNQIETQEHGDGQDNVHVSVRLGRCVVEGQACCPREGVLAWDGVDGAHQDFQADEEDALIGHGYPPVVCCIVHHKQLRTKIFKRFHC